MSDAPKLAEVKTIYQSNMRDIPAMLRLLAQDIETGKLGAVEGVTTVIRGREFEVRAWGDKSSIEHSIAHCSAALQFLNCHTLAEHEE